MPSGPIQSPTAGLLSLLGVNNMGKNPDTMGDGVTPAIEMTPWWLRGQSVPYQDSTTTGGATGSLLAFGATERQWIYLHHASFAVQVAAASLGTERLTLDVVSLGTGRGVYFDVGRITSVGAANMAIVFQLRDFWIAPGHVARIQHDGGAAGNVLTIRGLINPTVVV